MTEEEEDIDPGWAPLLTSIVWGFSLALFFIVWLH